MRRGAILAGLIALLCAGRAAAQATPTGVVAIASGSITTSSATLTLTTTIDAPVKSRVMCFPAIAATTQINTVTDTASNTWNARISQTGAASRTRMFDAFVTTDMPVGTTITITYNGTASNAKIAACVLIPNLTVGSIGADQNHSSTNAGSTTPSVSGSAPASAYEIVFGGVFVVTGASDTFTEATGWTTISTVNQTSALHLAYQFIPGSTASPVYAPTLGTSREWDANMVSYKLMPPTINTVGAGAY